MNSQLGFGKDVHNPSKWRLRQDPEMGCFAKLTIYLLKEPLNTGHQYFFQLKKCNVLNVLLLSENHMGFAVKCSETFYIMTQKKEEKRHDSQNLCDLDLEFFRFLFQANMLLCAMCCALYFEHHYVSFVFKFNFLGNRQAIHGYYSRAHKSAH